jgi:hypothetical protein
MIPLILFLSSMIAYGSKHWIIGTVLLVVTIGVVAV